MAFGFWLISHKSTYIATNAPKYVLLALVWTLLHDSISQKPKSKKQFKPNQTLQLTPDQPLRRKKLEL
jgi:hypothetical protein